MIDIAVVFTCFNRRESSVNCIKKLQSQVENQSIVLRYYICDDQSTDGTVEAIRSIVPEATISISKGDLFWSRGMHVAMDMARKEKHDFYLMINDDTIFEPDALNLMLKSYSLVDHPCGIVGTMRSISGKEITYGGQQYISKRKFGKSQFIEPEEKPVKCDIANWNCFLIPQEVIDNVGIIDSKYEHGLGDFDYSLMMQKKGYNIYTSIGYIGKVDRNSIYRTYMDVNLKKQLRIKNLFSRKGRPIKSEFYFYIKHHGFVGFLYCIYLYIRLLIDIIK